MSPDKVTEARMKYTDLSFEYLKSKSIKVAELRKIAREVGISKVFQDNRETPVSKGRKEELAKAIYEACEVYKASQAVGETEEIEKQTTLSEVEKTSEYVNSYERVDALAKKFYYGDFDESKKIWNFKGLRECAIEMEIDPFIPDFMVLIASVKPTLENQVKDNSKSDTISVNTLSNARSNLLKRIEKLVESEERIPIEIITKAYNRFSAGVMATFKSVQTQKAANTNINLNKRQNNAVEVKVANLVNWAIDTVTNLPESPTKWREVAIAIMILTGRRQSEVMATAKFSLKESESSLMFSGQLKKHTDDLVNAFEIPIIGNKASAVINAVNWLELNNKRCVPKSDDDANLTNSAKSAHDRFSRYLSEKVKEVCDNFLIPVDGASLVSPDEKGKMKDRRTCHLMRQIYGQLVIPIFHPSVSGIKRKANQILTEIMGHSKRESSIKHAATAYDSDIFIVDIDEVKSIYSQPRG